MSRDRFYHFYHVAWRASLLAGVTATSRALRQTRLFILVVVWPADWLLCAGGVLLRGGFLGCAHTVVGAGGARPSLRSVGAWQEIEAQEHDPQADHQADGEQGVECQAAEERHVVGQHSSGLQFTFEQPNVEEIEEKLNCVHADEQQQEAQNHLAQVQRRTGRRRTASLVASRSARLAGVRWWRGRKERAQTTQESIAGPVRWRRRAGRFLLTARGLCLLRHLRRSCSHILLGGQAILACHSHNVKGARPAL